MELLLHYIWKHRLYDATSLTTTSGEYVDVIDAGQHNTDAGPDFFNAKVKINGVMWVGNVEIHERANEWYAHDHDKDSAYDNTILHVVNSSDGMVDVVTSSSTVVPTVVLAIPQHVQENYSKLIKNDDFPRCYNILPQLSEFTVHSWLSALLAERLEERAALVTRRAEMCGNDWERAFFITLARNFGFGKNGDEFEQWASNLPLSSIAHHRDNPFQVESMFMGWAGLLEKGPLSHENEMINDEYRQKLLREYTYLCKKFRWTDAPSINWKFMRMRPQSLPHIRLVQLCDLYCRRAISISAVVDAKEVKDLERLLECGVTDYWRTHYTFGCQSVASDKHLTRGSIHLIIINTVVPVLWAYGKHLHRPALQEQAMRLLENLRSEQNYIMRQWQACGIDVKTAADSQALIQLKRTRCDRYDCLRCRFCYSYLKQGIDLNSKL